MRTARIKMLSRKTLTDGRTKRTQTQDTLRRIETPLMNDWTGQRRRAACGKSVGGLIRADSLREPFGGTVMNDGLGGGLGSVWT